MHGACREGVRRERGTAASVQAFRTDTKGRAAFYVGATGAQQCLVVTSVREAPLADELRRGIDDLRSEVS